MSATLVPQAGPILGYETLRALTFERTNFARLISANLSGRLEAARSIDYARYETAMKLAQCCRSKLDDIFRAYDMLLVPSAPGEAPASLATTGDPIFGVIWTTLHVPCVTLPRCFSMRSGHRAHCAERNAAKGLDPGSFSA